MGEELRCEKGRKRMADLAMLVLTGVGGGGGGGNSSCATRFNCLRKFATATKKSSESVLRGSPNFSCTEEEGAGPHSVAFQ